MCKTEISMTIKDRITKAIRCTQPYVPLGCLRLRCGATVAEDVIAQLNRSSEGPEGPEGPRVIVRPLNVLTEKNVWFVRIVEDETLASEEIIAEANDNPTDLQTCLDAREYARKCDEVARRDFESTMGTWLTR